MNLKAVIFPHSNDYNNDNNKNNRFGTGYDGEPMTSGLISYAALLLRQLFIGMDLVRLLSSFGGVDVALEAIASLRVRRTARR